MDVDKMNVGQVFEYIRRMDNTIKAQQEEIRSLERSNRVPIKQAIYEEDNSMPAAAQVALNAVIGEQSNRLAVQSIEMMGLKARIKKILELLVKWEVDFKANPDGCALDYAVDVSESIVPKAAELLAEIGKY